MSQQPRVRRTKTAAKKKKRPHKRISPATQPIEADAFYDDVQLARRWGTHRMTPWRWAREGRIAKPVRIGPGTSRWKGAHILAHERSLQDGGE